MPKSHFGDPKNRFLNPKKTPENRNFPFGMFKLGGVGEMDDMVDSFRGPLVKRLT